MVVIHEHKTYFVSFMLHLPHGLGQVELTAAICHLNYVNIMGLTGNGRMQHTLNLYTVYKGRRATCSLQKKWMESVCR